MYHDSWNRLMKISMIPYIDRGIWSSPSFRQPPPPFLLYRLKWVWVFLFLGIKIKYSGKYMYESSLRFIYKFPIRFIYTSQLGSSCKYCLSAKLFSCLKTKAVFENYLFFLKQSVFENLNKIYVFFPVLSIYRVFFKFKNYQNFQIVNLLKLIN